MRGLKGGPLDVGDFHRFIIVPIANVSMLSAFSWSHLGGGGEGLQIHVF